MVVTPRQFRAQTNIPLFAENPSHPFVPLACKAAAARRVSQGRPLGRRRGALPLTGVSTVAGWSNGWKIAFSVIIFFCLASLSIITAKAQTTTISSPLGANVSTSFDGFISEAAHRFGIPAAWIRAVIQVESNGDADAVSPKGAIGLMQVMPGTYQDMRQRYGLGADPFQPHDNVLAGAAYLREMLDCYGTTGFLAAYNAGPERYDQHLATGRALPDETILYVARITPMLSGVQAESTLPVPPVVADWQRSSLFAGGFSSSAANETSPDSLRSVSNVVALTPQSSGMFAPHFMLAAP